MTLYEGGFRIGELLGLQIKHVSFDNNGAQVTVAGKTGMRRVRIIASAPLLSDWIEAHPRKDDPSGPLWPGIGTLGRGEPIDYEAVRMMLIRVAGRAGIKKAINPHVFPPLKSKRTCKHADRGLAERDVRVDLELRDGSSIRPPLRTRR